MKLRLSADWEPTGDRVTWTLALRNRTGKALALAFGTGQYGDVALVGRGRAVYRWSRGLGFTQALWCRTLAPHETYVRSLHPSALDTNSLEDDRYELVASVMHFQRIEARYPLTITSG